MEAKNWEDTVMSEAQVSAIIFKCKGTVKEARQEVNKVQAEISFPAGAKKVVDLLDKYHPEWRDYIKAVMAKEAWQAFLKELGIKEEK